MSHSSRCTAAKSLVLSALLWGSCTFAQELARVTADEPRVPDSVVTLPVTVDFSAGRALLLQQMPQPLASGRIRQKVPVHVSVLKPVTKIVEVPRQAIRKVWGKLPKRVKVGSCIWNPLTCFQTMLVDVLIDEVFTVIDKVEQTVMAPVNELSPLDVEIAYGASVTDLDFNIQGEMLTASVVIEAFVNGSVDASVLKVGAVSCGVKEAKPRIRLTTTGPVRWTPEGTLTFSQQAWKLDWERPCLLTAFDIKAEDLLDLPGIRGIVQKKLEEGISKLPSSYSLRPHLENAWLALGKPLPLHEGAWLQVHPVSLAVGGLKGNGKTVSAVASVTARPFVTYGDEPEAAAVPFPAIGTTLPTSRRFTLSLEGEVSLREAESQLVRKLETLLQGAGKGEFQVAQVRLQGNADGLIEVTLGLTRPLAAEIHLRGMLHLDAEKEELRIQDPAFTVVTDEVSALLADALFHDTVLEWVRAEVRFPLPQRLRKSGASLQQAFIRGESYEVKIQPEALRLTGVRSNGDMLKITASAEGTAEGTFKL
ncbi:DUF4403 family protein [Corallococcus llansteffanensis]|nr:DUF4403 family protein [Corallococcus llansteffanensis]